MKFTASQIATILNGKIVGDEKVTVTRLSKIEEGEAGTISFLSNAKYTNYIYSTKASIVIVNDAFTPERKVKATLIKVKDSYGAFTELLSHFNQATSSKNGIEKQTHISKSATIGAQPFVGAYTFIGENVKIGNNVKIYPQVYIGDNVRIGDNTVLFMGCKIYDRTLIGNNCIIHANVVIGSDGFGFAPTTNGDYQKIPQTGNVVIGDKVEIGANSAIDKATLGSTKIGNGVKLDNLIQIAHNVEIDDDTVIAAQTGIAGSTKIGKRCVIGGQVGIVGHITIGDDVKIQAQSGIARSLKKGAVVQGTPAFNYSDWNKSYVYFRNLPQAIRDLEKKVKELNNLKDG